jgi:hypothetical protein
VYRLVDEAREIAQLAGWGLEHEARSLIAGMACAHSQSRGGLVGATDVAGEQRPAIAQPRLHGGDRCGGDAIAVGEGEPAHSSLVPSRTRFMRDPPLHPLTHRHRCRGRTGEGGADRDVVEPRLVFVEAQRVRDHDPAFGSGVDMDERLLPRALCHRCPLAPIPRSPRAATRP